MESINMNTFDQGPYNNFVPEPTQKKNNKIFWWIVGSLFTTTISIICYLKLTNKINFKNGFRNEN